jgi:hypothetical protein
MYQDDLGLTKDEQIALKLVWAQNRVSLAQRPVDEKIARAELLGMAKIVGELYTITETHVEMIVRKVFAANGSAPFNSMNAQPRKDWEIKSAKAVHELLVAGDVSLV